MVLLCILFLGLTSLSPSILLNTKMLLPNAKLCPSNGRLVSIIISSEIYRYIRSVEPDKNKILVNMMFFTRSLVIKKNRLFTIDANWKTFASEVARHGDELSILEGFG